MYAYINNDDIEIDQWILHATLHTIPMQKVKGAIDMAVDQTKPKKIAIADALYVKTEKGIYRRELCEDCVIVGEEKRKQIAYYD